MSEEKSDIMNLMSRRDVNKSALVTTLDGINLIVWDELWDKYTTVNCQDGSKAFILKDPLKAFEIYGREWDSKLKIVLEVFNKLKAEGEIELKKKIEKIFENLNYIEATLR